MDLGVNSGETLFWETLFWANNQRENPPKPPVLTHTPNKVSPKLLSFNFRAL